MKIKSLLAILSILFSTLVYTSCNDDLNSVGGDIKPGPDDIIIKFDTVNIVARTVAMDSIYARTIFGLVGEFEEPLFGKIKSDYLCELYCDTAKFNEGNGRETIKIDSVQFNIVFFDFMGDSISPMNISIYKLNNQLRRHFFTNIDPREFYSPEDIVGQASFTVSNLAMSSTGSRTLSTPLDMKMGTLILDTWKNSPEQLYSSASLREILPGFYVTSNLSNGTTISVDYSMFDIYYNYQGKNYDQSADSTYHDVLRFMVTPEVIQLNRVEADNEELLRNDKPDRSYIKGPTGVCTELKIPIKQILDIAGDDQVINSAKFNLLGFSELEAASEMYRPANLLFINKDSLENFFVDRKLPDSNTSFLLANSNTVSTLAGSFANRYVISSSNTSVGNIALMINHYSQMKQKGLDVPDELTYMLLPVSTSSSSSGAINSVYQTMYPVSAILRTSEDDLRMPLVFSRYNSSQDE